ncbi:secretoglobin family 1D member 2-like [Sturnira hondurensis]|uniref:secretoglobin family 1D member 2-like n=1 Tax=Sturnira hondurensis TaxID=192404 RepID=UPI00187AF0EC|nr:secretoglobin family 1D member 2-like [Sturnira hondurensis]
MMSPAANCSLFAKAELKASLIMRLSLCVLLVTMAFFCYEANAKVCPAFMSELRSFFLDPAKLYNIHILKFRPPREAAEAVVQVKQCVDLIPSQYRQDIFSVVKVIQSKCNS